jgi:hypothetical protein
MASLIDIQADKDLVVKMQFESIFMKELRSLFNVMLNDFRVVYAATGRQPTDGKYNNQWETLLKKHYTRVQKKFTRNVGIEIKRIDVVDDQGNEDIKSLLLLSLLTWQDENAEQGADLIGNTTSRQMRDAIAQARESLLQDGESIDNRNVAATASAILKRRFKGRIQNIATTETQTASEATKQIVGESIEQGLIEDGDIPTPVVGTVTKTWRTVGDNRVRPTHVLANGQTRLLNESYSVGGQLLRYPGDRGLGADPKETSGCRCSSILSALGKVVNFHGIR